MKSFKWMIVFLMVAVLELYAVESKAADRIFNMTVGETEETVIEWLNENGFKIVPQSQSSRLVDLLAIKKPQNIRIIIKQHSPIDSRVNIIPQNGNTAITIYRLWRHLDGQISLPSSLSVSRNYTIPHRVRSHVRSVVCIFAVGRHSEVQLTGFAVDPGGLIVCTGHDLKIDQHVTILLKNGREVEGVVAKIDQQLDLALIRAQARFNSTVSLLHGRFTLYKGDRLFAVTCPSGGAMGIKSGVLDGPPRRVDGQPLWQVQMPSYPGSSGSPVFDGQGRIAAVVKGRFLNSDSIGFLIPLETLLRFLEND